MTMMNNSSSNNSRRRSFSLSPSVAWLTLFVPALSYFLISRIGGGSSSSTWNNRTPPPAFGSDDDDDVVASHHVRVVTDDDDIKDVLYTVSAAAASVDSSLSLILLQHPLYLVQKNGLTDIVSSCWKHDSDLNRGYLLLSEASNTGRIWRWEVGGGPISIGKTLYMKNSGCRSRKEGECRGSGPLAIDFFNQQQHHSASEGRLIIAEYGEERIVRVETETGARTPLILQVPTYDESSSSSLLWRRIDTPTHLVMTPFGDLLVLEQHHHNHHSTIYRLKQAVLMEPLPDPMTSRRAHGWTNLTYHTNQQLQVVYYNHDTTIGSMALDETWTALYATIKDNNNDEVWLVRMSILDDDDEEEDENEPSSQPQQHGIWNARAKLVSNLSLLGITTPPRAMAVDSKGHVYLGANNEVGGVVILNSNTKEWLGTLPVQIDNSSSEVTSLTLGEDGHLYVTTRSQLLRIRVKHGPVVVPTNMLPKAASDRV